MPQLLSSLTTLGGQPSGWSPFTLDLENKDGISNLLHSAFGVFLIALWHACILMLAYCWGAKNIMDQWIAENQRMWPDDDEGGDDG